VAVDGVYAETQQLHAPLLKLLILPRERHKLGGTHRREVGGVAEQQQPLALIVAEALVANVRSEA
jgi:hypothetical protein